MSGRAERHRILRDPVSDARTGTVSLRAVARLIDVGAAAGIPRGILMDAASVTDADLADGDGRVPVAAEIALWLAFARRVSDPGFGVRAGAAFQMRQMGLLGYVCSFSSSVRSGLRRLERYGRIFTEAVEVTLDERGAQVIVQLAHPVLGPGTAFAQDYRLAALLRCARDLTRVDLVPVGISLTHKQPISTIAYREYFRCPITFGAAKTQLILRASDVDLPIPRGDETLAGYLSAYAEQVLASLLRGETTRHRTRAAIWAVLGEGTPTLRRVATTLGLPPRTLQRRLNAEGTTFHREIEDIRRSMAAAMLRDQSLAIGDVAFALGYSEPSAFHRSFKRWTGRTPRQFRSIAA